VITAKSAHGVARTSLRRVGHPARALDWVQKRNEKSLCFFPLFLSDHPLSQLLHSKSGYIFENPLFFCVE